jgi:hypothetical protein
MEMFLLIFLILSLGSIAYAASQGAPWVPTRSCDIGRIVRLCNLKHNEHFVELGCGDGRVCRAVASAYPQARVEGIELSVFICVIFWIQNFFTRSRARARCGNVFKTDLSSADVVYIFLTPRANDKLKIKLENELKSGSRVISYAWPIIGWNADCVDEKGGAQKIYLYQR